MLTSYPGFARCVAILQYTFMRVRMEFGRNKIFYGRSKVENGRTKWIVLGQIVHALFISSSSAWVAVFWCLAHRLELSLKDALGATLSSSIDDMLMRVYYLYEKSPKKCRDLRML